MLASILHDFVKHVQLKFFRRLVFSGISMFVPDHAVHIFIFDARLVNDDDK